MEKDLNQFVDQLSKAKHLVISTGAGVSAESGIPTYRDTITGLWEEYDVQELATPQAFMRNPLLVWNWYLWRIDMMAKCAPNPGHYAIAQFEKLLPKVTLITQNIDGLHEAAGSTNPIELHGNIHRVKCFDCERLHTEPLPPPIYPPTPEGENPVPRCIHCEGLLRADVVWFGENLPLDALQAAKDAAATCDLFMSIGTSSMVYPAAYLPILAHDNHALLVEVNPNETDLTPYVDIRIKGKAGKVLPILSEMLEKNQ